MSNKDTPQLDGDKDTSQYTIEQVATRTNLTKRTLRYYEEMQLLPPAPRTEGNYRRYSEMDIQRILRIKELRDLLGFSLTDIRDILQAEDERDHIRDEYRQSTDIQTKLERLDRADQIIHEQLELVEHKIIGLQQMRDSLVQKLAHHKQLKTQLKTQE